MLLALPVLVIVPELELELDVLAAVVEDLGRGSSNSEATKEHPSSPMCSYAIDNPRRRTSSLLRRMDLDALRSAEASQSGRAVVSGF